MRIMFLNQAPRKSAAYEAAKIEAQLNSYASPGTKVEIVFPDNYAGSRLFDTIGAQSVLNGLHHMMETPSIVRKIFWAAQNGYDAVISSNTFDPGVDGGRLAVDIPVIGLLRTSMHAALTLADRVGITVPLPGHVPYTWRILRAYGLERFVSDILPLRVALSPYVVDPADLAKATGVQVLNTKAIGIRFAEMCVALRMSQSALTYPRAKLSYEDFVNT